jgi:CRISPR-associated endoribonuclease Cas6
MLHAVVLELAGEKHPRYLGRYAHGLFFALLAQLDPDLAKKLHEAPRKPFTLTPLPGRNGAVSLRFTTLDGALFGPFLKALLEAAPEGLWLGEDRFLLKRVLATPEGHPLAGAMTWEELKKAPAKREVQLRFLTPTVFTTSKPGGRARYTPLSDPRLIAGSLLDKWQAHSPFPYNPKEEAALRELFELDLEVAGFRHLRFHRVQAGKGFFPGFTGEVTLRLWSDSLEVQEALGRLHALAFFSGVGAKTPYGMGLTLPL